MSTNHHRQHGHRTPSQQRLNDPVIHGRTCQYLEQQSTEHVHVTALGNDLLSNGVSDGARRSRQCLGRHPRHRTIQHVRHAASAQGVRWSRGRQGTETDLPVPVLADEYVIFKMALMIARMIFQLDLQPTCWTRRLWTAYATVQDRPASQSLGPWPI